MPLWGEAALVLASVRAKWPSLSDDEMKAALKAADKKMKGKRVDILQAQQALEDAVTEMFGPPTAPKK